MFVWFTKWCLLVKLLIFLLFVLHSLENHFILMDYFSGRFLTSIALYGGRWVLSKLWNIVFQIGVHETRIETATILGGWLHLGSAGCSGNSEPCAWLSPYSIVYSCTLPALVADICCYRAFHFNALIHLIDFVSFIPHIPRLSYTLSYVHFSKHLSTLR